MNDSTTSVSLAHRQKQLREDAVTVEAWIFAMVRAEKCTVPAKVIRAIDSLVFEAPIPREQQHNIWAITQQYERLFQKEEGRVNEPSVLQELRLPV